VLKIACSSRPRSTFHTNETPAQGPAKSARQRRRERLHLAALETLDDELPSPNKFRIKRLDRIEHALVCGWNLCKIDH
jgi:hypothetical protein